jgi:aspartyl-tRNA(Asn)/glutamyl-tRNA(Gln) amidotransferase subunit C
MDRKTVAKVASLARIKMDDADLDKFAPQLSGILEWVEMLNEVDTENVEPLSSVVDISLPLREDEVTDGGIRDKVLANAPEETEGFFVVPKIVE